MVTPALGLDMAFDSTSMAYDLALPIVALSINALLLIAHPVVALRVSHSTFLLYKNCGIWSNTAGTVEVGFEGQEVGDDSHHSVTLLSEIECGCKGSPFFGIREVGHDVEFPPRVFDTDVAYDKFIDYLSLG
jgi:hypothetical protein